MTDKTFYWILGSVVVAGVGTFAAVKIVENKRKSDKESASVEDNAVAQIDVDANYVAKPIAHGEKLYATGSITVNEAIRPDKVWRGTGNLYGKFSKGDEIGRVYATGIVAANDTKGNAGKRYYIIKKCLISANLFGWNPGYDCDYGVVIDSQVTSKN